MPYKLSNREVWSKGGGEWHMKQRCRNRENALAALRLLQMKLKGEKA